MLFEFRPAWFPLPISPEALTFDRQFSRTLWTAGVLFICAQLLLAWTVLRRGRDREIAPTRRGSPEIWWTAAASALFLTLAVSGSRGWAKGSGSRAS